MVLNDSSSLLRVYVESDEPKRGTRGRYPAGVLLLEEGFDQLTSFSLCFTELFFSGPISFFIKDLGHPIDLNFHYFLQTF